MSLEPGLGSKSLEALGQDFQRVRVHNVDKEFRLERLLKPSEILHYGRVFVRGLRGVFKWATRVFSNPSWRSEKYTHVLGGIKDGLEKHWAEEPLSLQLEHVVDIQSLDGEGFLDLPDASHEKLRCHAYALKALQLLESPDPNMAPRECYKAFVKELRRALDCKYYHAHEEDRDDPTVELLQCMCLVMFSEVEMQDYLKETVETVGGPIGELPDESHPLGKRMERVHHLGVEQNLRIRKAPQSSKVHIVEKALSSLAGEFRYGGLDPLKHGGSPVYHKYSIKTANGRTVRSIRMPTPTIGSGEDCRICPEFKGYLAALKKRGLKHVDVNFQDNRKWKESAGKNRLFRAFGFQGERKRIRTIEKLSEEPKYRDALQVVTLNKNSDFYEQSGDFSADVNLETFKVFFKSQLHLRAESGFYFPEGWATNEMDEVVERIGDALFPIDRPLNKWERKAYIELVYACIEARLANGENVYSIATHCKDYIDRGTSAAYMLFAMSLFLQEDKSSLSEKMQWMPVLTAADPLMGRAREIILDRLHRAFGFIEVLSSASWQNDWPEQKRKLQGIFPVQEISLRLER